VLPLAARASTHLQAGRDPPQDGEEHLFPPALHPCRASPTCWMEPGCPEIEEVVGPAKPYLRTVIGDCPVVLTSPPRLHGRRSSRWRGGGVAASVVSLNALSVCRVPETMS
jgi:hypothetical protein